MALPASSLFQGQDWITHRLPVAQAFDTLDRMGELCHPMMVLDMGADDITIELASVLEDLAEELNIQLDIVLADLFPYLQNNVALRWVSVELRMLATQMRALLAVPDDLQAEGERLMAIGDQLSNIKSLLKKLDQ